MILVTIGMNDAPYDSLFQRIDDLAPNLGEKIVMQVGNTGFFGKNTECFTYLNNSRMEELFDKADLVIAHAGVGTIINALQRNIPMVLVPREVVKPDVTKDQQASVAKEVESLGRGVVLTNLDDLEDCIIRARNLSFGPYSKNTSLCDYLAELFSEINHRLESKGKHRILLP